MNLGKTIRRIKKNKLWFGLNTLGLSIALLCLILVYSFIKMELSYDQFHDKQDHIFRITSNSNTGISSMIDARLQKALSFDLEETFPEIEDIVHVNSYRNAIVIIEEETFYSKKVFAVDSTFFNIFSFDLLLGNKEDVFNRPKQVALSESMAKKYFGRTDVLGEKIEIVHQKKGIPEKFTIKGIIKDAPQNSHFKFDILTSFEQSQVNTLDFTYLLLNTNASTEKLEKSIQKHWDKRFEEEENTPLVNLQALADIHLKSDKTREMERNGSVLALWLLISGIVIILAISFINYSNLNFVQFINDAKLHQIKLINGARRIDLILDSLIEAIVMLFIVIAISIGLAHKIAMDFQFYAFDQISIIDILAVILLFASFVFINAIWPYFTYGFKNMGKKDSLKQRKSYKYFVVFQIALAFIALGSILIIQKQLNHINELHPNGDRNNIIAMPNNSFDVISNFDIYKERLLKHPEIIGLSAIMEEPAGTVTDNFPFEIQGMESDEYATVNILSVDSNFFGFFDINPIAGTVNFTNQCDLDWDINAMRSWRTKQRGEEVPADVIEKVSGYQAEYIINKTALSHLGFHDENDALGKRFRFTFMDDMFPYGEIIGVVDDFHYTNLYSSEKPMVMVNRRLFTNCFLIRIDDNHTSKALEIIRKEWDELNPDFPFNYEFITDSYQKVYRKEHELAKVLKLFGLVSVFLAALGLFAMVSFNLERRTKEIGIRKVNGATTIEVITLLLKSYSLWVFMAIIIGAPFIYLLMNKWLESFAYRTNIDIQVFLQAGMITWIIAILTVSIISIRTAMKNPIESIRYE